MLSIFPQAAGELGIRQTLAKMVALANAAQLDPMIRDQAALAMSGCPQGHKVCIAHALLNWVSRMVRYVPDPADHELLHDPRLIARGIAERKMVYGDCDDMSLYLATLLKAVGLQPSFRAVGYNGRPWQHVYVVFDGIKLDATRSAWTVNLQPFQETSWIEEKV